MSTAPDTRRRLLEQGRLAFAEKGHDGVSLQRDILEVAGISTGSFYHQFKDKTELLVAILEEASENGRRLLSNVPVTGESESLEDGARRAFDFFFDFLDSAGDIVRIRVRESQSADPRVRELLREVGAQWADTISARVQSAMPGDGPLDTVVTGRLINALSIGIAVQYLGAPTAERPELRARLLDALAPFTTAGVTALADNARNDRA